MNKSLNNNITSIYGKYPAFNLLLNGKRKICQIYITSSRLKELELFFHKNKRNISKNILSKIIIKDNSYLDNYLKKIYRNKDILHQSIIVNVKNDILLNNINFSNISDGNLVILDNLYDYGNIGAIIRDIVAFNIKNLLIIKENNNLDIDIIYKTSAGLADNLNIFIADNLNNIIQKIKSYFTLIATNRYGNINLKDLSYKDYQNKKLAIIFGNEAQGIDRKIIKKCDISLKIDINQSVDSLSVSHAAAIILYSLTNLVN